MKIDIKAEIEKIFYIGGFNCAETTISVIMKSGVIDTDAKLIKMMTGFGGGMTRGYLCGSVVAAVSALGFLYGRTNKEQSREISKEVINRYLDQFIKGYGTVQCGALIRDFETKTEAQYAFCKKVIEFSLQAFFQCVKVS